MHKLIRPLRTAGSCTPDGRPPGCTGSTRIFGLSGRTEHWLRSRLQELYSRDERVHPLAGTAFRVVQAVNTLKHYDGLVRGAARAERNMLRSITGVFWATRPLHLVDPVSSPHGRVMLSAINFLIGLLAVIAAVALVALGPVMLLFIGLLLPLLTTGLVAVVLGSMVVEVVKEVVHRSLKG